MIKVITFLFTLSLVGTQYSQAQIGQADPQNSFPVNDSLVIVSADFLAQLLNRQSSDEMMAGSTIINLEEVLSNLENIKLAKAGLKVYPDVTPDYLQLDLPYDRDYSISVYNSDFEQVLWLDNAFGSNQLNLHDLAEGNYKVELQCGEEKFVKRIRKE